MRRYLVLSLLTLFVLAAASPALANHFTDFTPAADCSGWSVSGSVDLVGDPYSDLNYSVVLNDGTSDIKTFSDTIHFTPESLDFSIGSDWGMELCGDFTATGTFNLVGPQGGDDRSFEITFTCDCPPPPPPPSEGCTRTPGYWKTHPDDWPVSGLTVGCVDYTEAQILEIMWMPTRGDATIKLFHHLVAAKLNVLNGASDSISDDIDAADDFLCDHALFSRPAGDLKTTCNDLKDTLEYYNQASDCDGGYESSVVTQRWSAMTPAQSKSWGSVKASFK